MKQKFIDLYMKMAQSVSDLSSAVRLQVGTVIVKDNVVTFGYNGTPSGWDNVCEDETVELYSGYEGAIHRTVLKTKPEVLHSEANALMKIAKSTISSEGATLFCTHAPCIDCAKMIHQAGIFTVYYRDTYKNEFGLDFLIKSGVNVTKYQ
jgi:dCMP deaminase